MPQDQRVDAQVLDAELLAPPEHDLSELLGYGDMPDSMGDSTNCGLRNLANTCYANVVLQSRAKLPSCRCWLANHLSTHARQQAHPTDCLLCTLARDITQLTSLPRNTPFRTNTVQQRAVWDSLGTFGNCRPQDADEAFCTLFRA